MLEGKNIHFSPVDSKPLCSFSAKLCKLRRLNGYAFCVRHILEDSSAPFKRCEFVVKSTNQRCSSAIPFEEERLYCHSHMQVLGLLPKKERKSKKVTGDGYADNDGLSTANQDEHHLSSSPSDTGVSDQPALRAEPEDCPDSMATPDSIIHPKFAAGIASSSSTAIASADRMLPGTAAKGRRCRKAMPSRRLSQTLSAAHSSDKQAKLCSKFPAGHVSKIQAHVKVITKRRYTPSQKTSAYLPRKSVFAQKGASPDFPPVRPPTGMYALLASARRYNVDLDDSFEDCLLTQLSSEPKRRCVRHQSLARHVDATDQQDISRCPAERAKTRLASELERLCTQQLKSAREAASLARYASLLLKCARSSCADTAAALLHASCSGSGASNSARTGTVPLRAATALPAKLPSSRGIRPSTTNANKQTRNRLPSDNTHEPEGHCNLSSRSVTGEGATSSIEDLHGGERDTEVSAEDGRPVSAQTHSVPLLSTVLTASNSDGFLPASAPLTAALGAGNFNGQHSRLEKCSSLLRSIPGSCADENLQQHLPEPADGGMASDVSLLSPISKAIFDIPLDHTDESDLLDDNEIQQVLNKLPDGVFGLFNGKNSELDFTDVSAPTDGGCSSHEPVVSRNSPLSRSCKVPGHMNDIVLGTELHVNNRALIDSDYNLSHADSHFMECGYDNPYERPALYTNGMVPEELVGSCAEDCDGSSIPQHLSHSKATPWLERSAAEYVCAPEPIDGGCCRGIARAESCSLATYVHTAVATACDTTSVVDQLPGHASALPNAYQAERHPNKNAFWERVHTVASQVHAPNP